MLTDILWADNGVQTCSLNNKHSDDVAISKIMHKLYPEKIKGLKVCTVCKTYEKKVANT